MRPFWSRLALLALVLGFSTSSLFAATYIVPPDRDIVRAARGIVIATGLSSYSVEGDDGRMTYTVYRLRVDEVLKGDLRVADTIDVTQAGGCIGSRCVAFPGVPDYKAGERALVFLESGRNGWTTWSAALGKFNFVHDAHGKNLLVRGGTEAEVFGWDSVGNAHVEPFRDETRFLAYVRNVIAGVDAGEDYVVPRADVTFPRPIRSNTNSGGFHASNYVTSPAARWKCKFDQPAGSMAGCGGNSSVTFTLFGTATGVNGTTAANAGMNAWNSDSLSNVSYVVGTSVVAAAWNRNDSASSIHFDDNDDVAAACGGAAVGCGGTTYDPTPYTFDGSNFGEVVAGDVAIKAGFTASQSLYNQVVCHELGHTLGFRHSNEGTPSTSSAIMVSVATTTFGAVLQTWDHDAVSTVYNPSPAGTCTPPTIGTQPQSVTITQGNSTTLSVTANGTAPFTYQWYVGNSGDQSTPTGSNSSSLQVSPSATTSYWVKVTGCSTSVDSNTATVTVNPPTCNNAQILGQPQSQTISQGGSAFLSVSASGTNLTFQWYRGNSGDTSNLVPGANNATFNTGALNATTSFWVRVQAQCGPAVNSNTATVTVTATSCPDVTVATPTAAQQPDGSYLLDVVASSSGHPLTYQWFIGPVPGSGDLFGTGRPITAPAPTAPTSYWVRVFNDCGKFANSPAVVTIAPCSLPTIDTEPADQSISSGASATMTVAFTSPTASTVRWYRGIAPDKTTQVGEGASFNTGALTQTTQFFASITNTCGEKFTRTATITVAGPICTKPAILSTSPASAKKNKGEFVTLSVVANGTTPLSYQWYEGATGDTSRPRGTDPSFTAGPLTTSTKFWVKVTNACGDASSNTINVDVGTPRYRSVRH